MILSIGNNVYIDADEIKLIVPLTGNQGKAILKEKQERNKYYNLMGKKERKSLVILKDNTAYPSMLKAETLAKRLKGIEEEDA